MDDSNRWKALDVSIRLTPAGVRAEQEAGSMILPVESSENERYLESVVGQVCKGDTWRVKMHSLYKHAAVLGDGALDDGAHPDANPVGLLDEGSDELLRVIFFVLGCC